MADAEGVIEAELKTLHGLGRVRCRGAPFFHCQLLLGCAVINLKRLARHATHARSGVAGTPVAARAAIQAGSETPKAHDSHTIPALRLAAQVDWVLTLSLN